MFRLDEFFEDVDVVRLNVQVSEIEFGQKTIKYTVVPLAPRIDKSSTDLVNLIRHGIYLNDMPESYDQVADDVTAIVDEFVRASPITKKSSNEMASSDEGIPRRANIDWLHDRKVLENLKSLYDTYCSAVASDVVFDKIFMYDPDKEIVKDVIYFCRGSMKDIPTLCRSFESHKHIVIMHAVGMEREFGFMYFMSVDAPAFSPLMQSLKNFIIDTAADIQLSRIYNYKINASKQIENIAEIEKYYKKDTSGVPLSAPLTKKSKATAKVSKAAAAKANTVKGHK